MFRRFVSYYIELRMMNDIDDIHMQTIRFVSPPSVCVCVCVCVFLLFVSTITLKPQLPEIDGKIHGIATGSNVSKSKMLTTALKPQNLRTRQILIENVL